MAHAGLPRYGRKAAVDDENTSTVNVPATRIPYGAGSGDGSLDSEADLNYDASTNTVRLGMASALETIAHSSQHTISGNTSGVGTSASDSYGQLNLRRIAAEANLYIIGKLKAWLGSSAAGQIAFTAVNTTIAAGTRLALSIVGNGTGGTVAGTVSDVAGAYEDGSFSAGLAGSLAADATEGFTWIRAMAGAPKNLGLSIDRNGNPFTFDALSGRLWFYAKASPSDLGWKKPNQDLTVEIAAPQTGNYSVTEYDFFVRYTGAGGHTFQLLSVASTWGILLGPNGTQGKAYLIRNDGGGNLTLARGAVGDHINGVAADYTLPATKAALMVCAGSADWWLQLLS